MKLPVLQYPDPRLSQKSEPIVEITDEIRDLARNMLETMYDNEGIGLAAPQVGGLRRVCVVLDEEDQLIELVNPEIIYTEGEQTGLEGCLIGAHLPASSD